ncbi:MAG: SDR family oxidoreductase [Pseudomonadota bacterium]
MGKLDGKTALITGSGRGIGQAIAVKLAGDGARIVVNDLDPEPAGETVARIKASGGAAIAVPGDVTEPGFADRYVAAAVEAYGGIDIIVNNAGYPWDAVVQKMSDDQFQAMLDVHLTAPFRVLRAAADPIRIAAKAEAEAGRTVVRKVVNISSIAGLFGNPGQSGYASGKAGVVGLTQTLAKEWGRYNVTVNCVAFGLIETRITQPKGSGAETAQIGDREIAMGVQPAVLDTIRQMIPLGRAGTPEDAANAVYLFCIPESDYISGETLLASGGLKG